MSFSTEWDSIYQANQHMSTWPWSDLITYVKRNLPNIDEKYYVLELGCGAGANISFFQQLKARYFATEGSSHIVKYLTSKFPALADNIKAVDFTKEIPFDRTFDLIFDRGSVCCNNTKSIENCISLISDHLKPGGFFIGIDWPSTLHTEFNNGIFTDDAYTKNHFPPGPYYNMGLIHFFDTKHIRELFKGFEFIKMEHKTLKQEFPESDYQMATWNFVVKKTNQEDKL
jgi:SAM-dependent methyltransferase